MAGAVVGGAHPNFAEAAVAMTGTMKKKFLPNPKNVAIYERLYRQYRRLHDIHGTSAHSENLHDLMKELLTVRDEVRR